MADNEHVLTEKLLNMPDTRIKGEPPIRYSEGMALDEYLGSLEEKIIADEMLKANGNISKAAESLKIRRQTLQHKLKKYGIK